MFRERRVWLFLSTVTSYESHWRGTIMALAAAGHVTVLYVSPAILR
jgi:hypothetical protein